MIIEMKSQVTNNLITYINSRQMKVQKQEEMSGCPFTYQKIKKQKIVIFYNDYVFNNRMASEKFVLF